MAKRLLRYGLSKADIFEDDALSLDNLELTLGRKNVVEFRDVGLKLKVRGYQPGSDDTAADRFS